MVDSKIYCNDFMPKEKGENGKAIKKKKKFRQEMEF